MWWFFGVLLAIGGFLIGGIAAGIGTGYLLFFKTFDYMGSASSLSEWVKIGSGICVLLFSKIILIVGFVAGGFFGSIPGLILMTKSEED